MEYSEKLNESFLKLYREWETMEGHEPSRASFYQRKYPREFETFRRIRNYLSHESFLAEYPVAVSLEVYNRFVSIMKEMQAWAFSMAKKDFASVRLSDNLMDTVKMMSKNDYSYVPILDSDKTVLGLVSSYSLIDLFADESKPKDGQIRDYMDFFVTHSDRIAYLGRHDPLYRAEEIFSNTEKGKKRQGLILFSEHGSKKEALLGLMSPSDLLCRGQ